MRGLELERANTTATPCAVENNSKGNARKSEVENPRGRRRTQSKHEWDDVDEGGSGHQPQMTDDETSDSQALTGGDITRYRALVARISYLSQDRPDLKFASMQVCCAMAHTAGHGAFQEDRAIPRWENREPDADSAGSRVASWRCTQTLTGEATRLPVGVVIMRGGHCLKTWTKKQQVVLLSSAESELYAAVKAASEGLGVQSLAKDLGMTCGLNLLGRFSNNVPGQSQRTGQSQTRRHAELVDTGGFQVWPVRHEERMARM